MLWQIFCFCTQKNRIKTQQQQKIKHNNSCWALNPVLLLAPSECVTSAPPSQLRVSIVVKLFNRFDAIGRNLNKQSRICGTHFFNEFIFFCNIFTCKDNCIWQFLKLTGVGFTA